MIPAIVIGAHTMGLGVIRSLGIMGIPVISAYYSNMDMGFVSCYVKEKVCLPHPEKNEQSFICELVNLGKKYYGVPLFPVSDEALKIVSKHKAELSLYFRVACVEWPIVRKIIEKNYTYELASSLGIPVPKTIKLMPAHDISEYLDAFEYPVLIKPVESHLYFSIFRKKNLKVQNQKQLQQGCERAFQAGLEVMLQEMIPGCDSEGVNYNSYFWEGQPLVEFTAKKIRNAPIELGSPCALKSQMVEDVLEPGRKLLKSLMYYGYSCTEFKRDPRDGAYKLVEVNGRNNLSTLLAVHCGINFPWLHYRHLVYGILPQAFGFREGFYWIDTERDLSFFSQHVIRNQEGLFSFFLPYLNPHVQAVFDVYDLKPFIKRYRDYFGVPSK